MQSPAISGPDKVACKKSCGPCALTLARGREGIAAGRRGLKIASCTLQATSPAGADAEILLKEPLRRGLTGALPIIFARGSSVDTQLHISTFRLASADLGTAATENLAEANSEQDFAQEYPLGTIARWLFTAPQNTWSECKEDARKTEGTPRKITPFIAAGRPIPHFEGD